MKLKINFSKVVQTKEANRLLNDKTIVFQHNK